MTHKLEADITTLGCYKPVLEARHQSPGDDLSGGLSAGTMDEGMW